MSLSAAVVDVAPDAIAIAELLRGRPGFAFLHAAAPGGWHASYVAVDPIGAKPSACRRVSPPGTWLLPTLGLMRLAGLA